MMIAGIGTTVSAETPVGRYSTDRLQTLASHTRLASLLDTIGDGCYYDSLRWEKYPVSVRVRDSVVNHIGIRLFTKSDRDSMPPSPVYDFMERYLLEDCLGRASKEYDYGHHKADGVVVEAGNLKNLHKVCGDSTLMFTVTLDNGRKYRLGWSRDEKEVFRISFPASNRLMCGYSIDEGERRLAARIMRADSTTRQPLVVDRPELEKCDSTVGSFHIRRGDCFVLPLVNNDRYYFVNDTITTLLYGPSYPIESIANLFVTGEIGNRFTARIRMHRYGGKVEEFSVPLNSLLNFFRDEEGCTPYFGLKGYYPERKRLTALFEMVNPLNGYQHLMSVTFDAETLTSREGDIDIRLTPYLPTHDVKNLYKPQKK